VAHQLLRGEARSLSSIAKSAGVIERHVSQVLRCGLLAPDLVETVLQGRQPAQLTFSHIMNNYRWLGTISAACLSWPTTHRPRIAVL
jgi:hypothetical protein